METNGQYQNQFLDEKFQKNLIVWKRSSGEAEVKEKQGVSEELNSVETKFGSYYERPINLWFQKNLIVWKP